MSLTVLCALDWQSAGLPDDSFAGHPSSVDSMIRFNDQHVLTGGSDGLIRLLRFHPNQLRGVVGSHQGFGVSSMSMSADRSVLASVGLDQWVRFWDLRYLAELDDEQPGGGSDGSDDDDDDSDDSSAAESAGKPKRKRVPANIFDQALEAATRLQEEVELDNEPLLQGAGLEGEQESKRQPEKPADDFFDMPDDSDEDARTGARCLSKKQKRKLRQEAYHSRQSRAGKGGFFSDL